MTDPDRSKESSREENRFITELYIYLLQTLGKKGYVKIADVKKIYNKTVSKDKSVSIRPLPKILEIIEKRLWFFFSWKLLAADDKIFFVNRLKLPPTTQFNSDDSHHLNGILKAALMFIYVAKNPDSKNPCVLHDDLMAFLEKACASTANNQLTSEERAVIHSLIFHNTKAHFVKKGWISFIKETNENEEEVFRYDWGPTAKASLNPTKLVGMFQMITKFPVQSLKEQSSRAYNDKVNLINAVKVPLSQTWKGRNKN